MGNGGALVPVVPIITMAGIPALAPPGLLFRGDVELSADGLIDGKADRFIVEDHLEALASGFEPTATGQSVVDQCVQESANTIERVGVCSDPKDLPAKTGDRAVAIRPSLLRCSKRFGDERVQLLRYGYSFHRLSGDCGRRLDRLERRQLRTRIDTMRSFTPFGAAPSSLRLTGRPACSRPQ